MKRVTNYFIIILIFCSCTKQNKNNRLFSGNWELHNLNIKNYVNNEEVSSKDTTYYGVMQLQNSSEVVDGNDAYFTGFEPFPSTFCHWNISPSKPKTIVFYLWNVDAGVNFSFSYNIEKITKKRMILTQYVSDENLNLNQKTTIEFEKK
jgi:hypothetical protein